MHIQISPGNMNIHIFLLFCTLPILVLSRSITLSHIKKLPLPPGLASPTSIAFSFTGGGGPYIGCSDGRILKYNGKTKTFEAFGYTSPNRNASLCDNTNNVDIMPTCGLPSSLGFHNDGNLYVVDAYYGLTSVAWPNGGKATINIPTDGAPPRYPPLNLPYALDVDVKGICRFTDATFDASPRDIVTGVGFPDEDSTGSMWSYDPSIDKLTLMTRGLYAPTGLATDRKANYILISESESSTKRVVKYWLVGNKSGTIEDVKNFTGIPQDITRNNEGHFWVANNIINNDSTVVPQGVKINGYGKVLATVNFSKDYDKPISIVLEHNKKLYVGGYNFTFIGVYRIL